MVRRPTEDMFKHMVSSKILNNSPIKVEDVTNTHTIFGTYLVGVQGKKVIHKPDRVKTGLFQIPRDLYELHKFLALTSDLMFLSGISFLITLSRKIIFLTVEHILSRMTAHLSSS